MKKLLSLLSCLLLFGCGEKKGVGDNGQTDTGSAIEKPKAPNESKASSVDGATVELPANEVADLPPLPEVVTKEFIMDLWAKPHDGRGIIEELADGGIREGVWNVISKRGPRKGEIIDSIESTMILKMIDRRYQVWEWREGDLLTYTVTTYDYDASTYRWWGASVSPEETSIFEHSGRRYWRNLMEWKAANLPDPEIQSTMRTTFISEDGRMFKVVGEAKRNGEVVSYSTGEFNWQSGLPEEHRSREAK
ncbi:MAG: hypothetical protein P8M65_01280 [Roseibacillus sp.]|nr:hypothetical protein [Roseibacillus sp.]